MVLEVGSCRPQQAISLQSSHLTSMINVTTLVVAFLAGEKDCSLSIRCFCGKWRREKRKGRERNERNCLSVSDSVSIESLFPSPAPSPKISSPFTPKAGLILGLKGRARKFILTREVLKCLEEVSLRKHPFLLALRRWGRFARRNVCD